MIQIVNGKEIPIKDTAIFVSKLNQQKVHHIGFCGTDHEEIQKSIKEDVSEMMAAVKDGKLIGWIGADTDEDTAEVWGPFVDAEYNRQIAFNRSEERRLGKEGRSWGGRRHCTRKVRN